MAIRGQRVLSNHLSNASVAPSEVSVATTVLDSDGTDGEVTVEQDSIAIQVGSPQLSPPVPPSLALPPSTRAGQVSASHSSHGLAVTIDSTTTREARSRSPQRPPPAPPQVARIISPGQLPVLPISTQPPHESDREAAALPMNGMLSEDQQEESQQQNPEWDPFAEEPPWGNLMNGSVMDEPYVPPPEPRGPREPAFLLVAPPPMEFLPGLLGGTAGAPMFIGAALRDALVGDPHLVNALCISDEPRGIEEGWHHASSRIRDLARDGAAFYIGITENPQRRWEEHCQAAPWDDMEILIEAPSSRVTAELERRLITHFRPVFGCANIGSGGERGSVGRPHFLYVLVRQSGLLRRSF